MRFFWPALYLKSSFTTQKSNQIKSNTTDDTLTRLWIFLEEKISWRLLIWNMVSTLKSCSPRTKSWWGQNVQSCSRLKPVLHRFRLIKKLIAERVKHEAPYFMGGWSRKDHHEHCMFYITKTLQDLSYTSKFWQKHTHGIRKESLWPLKNTLVRKRYNPVSLRSHTTFV